MFFVLYKQPTHLFQKTYHSWEKIFFWGSGVTGERGNGGMGEWGNGGMGEWGNGVMG
ncbi:hypothetical protein MICAF_2630002 [Microcystis aeruginosa PCC 9807]|uniref:Uncharacterized protein n=1 Tax=Microcystis aeruginosa PCC 9807 TaxID=1160283 RepID=I4H5D1_MICAE|nr:hypothetical protein MICAF_2630002 [Microcystis aeruginosa PCC 9807]